MEHSAVLGLADCRAFRALRGSGRIWRATRNARQAGLRSASRAGSFRTSKTPDDATRTRRAIGEKTGACERPPSTTIVIASAWMKIRQNGITVNNHAMSLSSCVASGERSGRKAAIDQNIACVRNIMIPVVPAANWVRLNIGASRPSDAQGEPAPFGFSVSG